MQLIALQSSSECGMNEKACYEHLTGVSKTAGCLLVFQCVMVAQDCLQTESEY